MRKTTLPIINNSNHVKINRDSIEKLAEDWRQKSVQPPLWPKSLHLETKNVKQLLTYLFILDAINFCFWHPSGEKWTITSKGIVYNGYLALALALKDYFEKNPEKADFAYFAKMPFSEFQALLGGGKNLLFLKTRWAIIRAISKYFLKNHSGNPTQLVLSGKQSLAILIPKIASEIPSFNDVRNYYGRRVYFWKRAQLLGLDIYGALDGQGLGFFKDLDHATAFADYKLPQILYAYGILEYNYVLEEILSDNIRIPVGSPAEIEIRSATIWAVEHLSESLKKLGLNFHPFQIDWLLWNQRFSIKRNPRVAARI